MGANKNQVFFLRKIGKIEFLLFGFSFAGMILNVFNVKGGKLVMGLGLIAFALLYFFVALVFRRISYKSLFDRMTSTFSYLFLSILIVGVLMTILRKHTHDIVIHVGLISTLIMMVIIQLRKFRVGLMSNDTTSLLYRLTIFWVIGLVTYYLIPENVF